METAPSRDVGGDVVVIGAGPAGMMAAEVMATAGVGVTLVDGMRAPGRKFLLAGRGGLNLTHSEPVDAMLTRYGSSSARLASAVTGFGPTELRAWSEGLGQPTFVGSSGRVFPHSMRATPLLRAWLHRLDDLGVQRITGARFHGWSSAGVPQFDNITVGHRPVLLALGGASWPGTGSDGGWVDAIRARGVAVNQLRAANSGFVVEWSPLMAQRFAGEPVKNVALTFAEHSVRGELMISARGIEGGAVYALSSALRAAIDEQGPVQVLVDLRPDVSVEWLADRLVHSRHGQTQSNSLRKAAGVSPVGVALMREANRQLPTDAHTLAALVKAVPVMLTAVMPIARAISSAGGIALDEIDDTWMLRKLPGTFVAGEMLDWDAPTGGYLLQATFATAVAAAQGMLRWLDAHQPERH